MEQLPVIQTFFDRPVRFFKTEFEVDLESHNGTPGLQKVTLKTWAIPLPDYCSAIGYAEPKIREMIYRNQEVFKGFHRIETIPDRSSNQQRRTILMAVEMCDGLNMKLHTTRIKDAEVREAVIRFQRWVLFAFHALRTGKLRPTYWKPTKEILDKYDRILLRAMGPETSVEVRELAREEKKTEKTIYRNLQKRRGGNALTSKGKPKKSPSFKGKHKMPGEAQKIIDTTKANPGLTNKEIWEQSGTAYSYDKARRLIREIRKGVMTGV